jgi:hypothetical protein
VPEDLRKKVLKQLVKDDRPCPKTTNVYNSWKKKNVSTIEEETKIPLFAIISGSLDILI